MCKHFERRQIIHQTNLLFHNIIKLYQVDFLSSLLSEYANNGSKFTINTLNNIAKFVQSRKKETSVAVSLPLLLTLNKIISLLNCLQY